MKKIAEEKDVDLLLVDSGDLHDGTGISDGYPAGSVDAHDVRASLHHTKPALSHRLAVQ